MANVSISVSSEDKSSVYVIANIPDFLSIIFDTYIKSGYNDENGQPVYHLYASDTVNLSGRREDLLDLSTKIQEALAAAPVASVEVSR